ncbi:MAG: PfkB family carbohydrate kinase [Simkaniaceae bacterium]|nr:PfkB family carbohydrate kinase [Simkaniaceae bacterium]
MVRGVDTVRSLPASVLLVGDFMLDTYTFGLVERISPEAPVPVLRIRKTKRLPGGAGNVACNLRTLGAHAVCVGRVGADGIGEELRHLLKERGVETEGLLIRCGVETPVKNRLIAQGQQLLRVDREEIAPMDRVTEEEAVTFMEGVVSRVDVVAVSDYAKGFLSSSLLRKIMQLGKKAGKPVLVDPKDRDFTRYSGATLVKPNLREARAGAQLTPRASLDEVGAVLMEKTGGSSIVITRSEEGMTLFDPEAGRRDFPSACRDVIDVTGAGDTVLAVIAATYGAGLPLERGIELANTAAGIVVERVGCIDVSVEEIVMRCSSESVCDLPSPVGRGS